VTKVVHVTNKGKASKETKPYYFVRWRWWDQINLEAVAEDFQKEFRVDKISFPHDELELFPHKKDARDELKVNADTLTARLSAFRGILYQRKLAYFTEKDVKLRRTVLNLYPRKRATPFSFPGLTEPKFEVKK
jgi:hypothetical protein